MVKTLKIFFSGTKRPKTLKLGMHHRVLKYYQVCSNDEPGLTLTYFTARSNLVPYAFVWEKGKTMDFSETSVVYDLKLATDDRNDKKKFLLTSKLCPPGAVCPAPCPGAIYSTACGKVLIVLCMCDTAKCVENTTLHARHMQDSCVIHATFPARQRYW